MLLTDSIDKAIRIQYSVVADHVQRVRRRHPSAEPAEIIVALEKQYLATVTGTGAVVGAAAALPRSRLARRLTTAEAAGFHEATALFTLAVADVRGMAVHDVERRRMLLLAIVFGCGRPGLTHSGNRVRRWLITRHHTKRWTLAISRILPFGIGAAIGAVRNRVYARMVVAACRQVLGPAPGTEPLLIAEHRPAPVALTNGQAPVAAAAQVTAAASVTGKYRPLFDHLAVRGSDRIELSFFEIDQMVTGGLPKSASAQRGWWSNSPARVQAKAWLAAGFQVTNVDLAATTVRFERRDSPE